MHNKRKKHNKYTQKRIHNKTARAYKRKLRHTRHNPRHNITHKQRGGEGGLLSLFKSENKYRPSAADDVQLQIPANTPPKKTGLFDFLNKKENEQELKENAETYSALGVGAQYKSDIVKGLAGVSLLTNIARVAVVGLAASGVGLPLAGVIATALIIANVFAQMNISNLNLKTVMYDTLNIISNSYILNDYINYLEYHMKTFNRNTSDNSNTNTDNSTNLPEEPNQIIVGLKARLKDKIMGLISYLLSIATDDMLISLQRDKSATPAIRELVDAENANRKGFSSFMARAGRVVNRTLKADRTTGYIIRDLSIINGYFMLVKSHFDLSLDEFERSLGTERVTIFWKNVKDGDDDTDTDLTKKDVIGQYNQAFIKNDKKQNPYMRYLYGGFNNENLIKDALKNNPNDILTSVNEKSTEITKTEKNAEDK